MVLGLFVSGQDYLRFWESEKRTQTRREVRSERMLAICMAIDCLGKVIARLIEWS